MSEYVSLPDGMDFNTQFPTYILAFCPDSDSWFATNKRFFYYEFPMEFQNEDFAIEFFKSNAQLFLNEEIRMGAYRPSFFDGGVFLDNIGELIRV